MVRRMLGGLMSSFKMLLSVASGKPLSSISSSSWALCRTEHTAVRTHTVHNRTHSSYVYFAWQNTLVTMHTFPHTLMYPKQTNWPDNEQKLCLRVKIHFKQYFLVIPDVLRMKPTLPFLYWSCPLFLPPRTYQINFNHMNGVKWVVKQRMLEKRSEKSDNRGKWNISNVTGY